MTIILDTLSAELAEALRKKAKQEGRTVEQVATEVLARGLTENGEKEGSTVGKKFLIDLTGVAGTMSEEDARAIEETVRWMDQGDLATRS